MAIISDIVAKGTDFLLFDVADAFWYNAFKVSSCPRRVYLLVH